MLLSFTGKKCNIHHFSGTALGARGKPQSSTLEFVLEESSRQKAAIYGSTKIGTTAKDLQNSNASIKKVMYCFICLEYTAECRSFFFWSEDGAAGILATNVGISKELARNHLSNIMLKRNASWLRWTFLEYRLSAGRALRARDAS